MSRLAGFTLTVLLLIPGIITNSLNAQEPEQWISYESPSFNYRINFPKVPKDLTEILETESGELRLNVAELDCSESADYNNLVYMMNCTVFPDSLIHSDFVEMLDNFFDNTINGAVSNISGELLSSRVVEYSGYPGREVRIAADGGMTVFTSKLFLIKSQFFMMIILTDKGKDMNGDINKFFDSFHYFSGTDL